MHQGRAAVPGLERIKRTADREKGRYDSAAAGSATGPLGSSFSSAGWRNRTGELVLEFFDAAGRIHEFQLAGIERMADVANIDLHLRHGAARGEGSCRSHI